METKVTRSWFLVIFGFIFFAVGLGVMVMSVIPTLVDGYGMTHWKQSKATLLSAKLSRYADSDGTTYQAKAQYQYRVSGVDYTNNRVSISDTSDNIGSFHKDKGKYLTRQFQSNQPIYIWYNPTAPEQSIIYRNIRWEKIGFMSIFALVFGAIGGGIMWWGYKGKTEYIGEELDKQPWLSRPEWHKNEIFSDAKSTVYVAFGFAILWNLISLPALFFGFPEIWRKEGAIALFLLAFPLIGLALLYWAVNTFREWKKFGRTPLRLDPYPGAIGGDVAGTLQTGIKYNNQSKCDITLSCIHSRTTGSGKSRSTHTTPKWQNEGVSQPVPSMNGSDFSFRFTVPKDLPASDVNEGTNYHYWQISAHIEVEGTNFNRTFRIPVFPTGKLSQSIKDNINTGKVQQTQIEKLLPIQRDGDDIHLHYQPFRHLAHRLPLAIIGLVFIIASAFLWVKAIDDGGILYLMAPIFSLMGLGIFSASIYLLFNHLYIRIQGKDINTMRTLFGIRLSNHSLSIDQNTKVLVKQGMSSKSGNKHRIEHNIYAQSGNNKVMLAEGIGNAGKADAVVEFYNTEISYRLIN